MSMITGLMHTHLVLNITSCLGMNSKLLLIPVIMASPWIHQLIFICESRAIFRAAVRELGCVCVSKCIYIYTYNGVCLCVYLWGSWDQSCFPPDTFVITSARGGNTLSEFASGRRRTLWNTDPLQCGDAKILVITADKQGKCNCIYLHF